MRTLVFDTETTGIDTATARIVSWALVDVHSTDHWSTLVNPGTPIPTEATAIHGITNEDVLDAHPTLLSLKKIVNLMKSDKIVCHNAKYDFEILIAELQRHEMRKELEIIAELPPYYCTLQECRKLHPWPERNDLNTACKRYGIDVGERDGQTGHGALIDAQLTKQLYLKIIGGTNESKK